MILLVARPPFVSKPLAAHDEPIVLERVSDASASVHTGDEACQERVQNGVVAVRRLSRDWKGNLIPPRAPVRSRMAMDTPLEAGQVLGKCSPCDRECSPFGQFGYLRAHLHHIEAGRIHELEIHNK